MEPQKITIQDIIQADRTKVWDCWTNPEHIIHWNFASPDWQCPEASNDLQVGGKYFARMEAKDGSFGFDFRAIYTEVEILAKLTYLLEDNRQVTTTFDEQGNSTVVSTIFDAETQNSLEMQRAGWQAILTNFKKYAENEA